MSVSEFNSAAKEIATTCAEKTIRTYSKLGDDGERERPLLDTEAFIRTKRHVEHLTSEGKCQGWNTRNDTSCIPVAVA